MTSPGDFPTDEGCIFCKIIAGDIPCYKLYEDELVISFLDIGPLARGHCLVIPKGHWVMLDRLPDEVAAGCGRVLPRLCRAVSLATGATAWNVLQNNGRAARQAVDHVHFHIIPKYNNEGLSFAWPATELPGAAATGLRQAIVTALSTR